MLEKSFHNFRLARAFAQVRADHLLKLRTLTGARKPVHRLLHVLVAGLLGMNLSRFLGLTLLGTVPLSAFYAWAGRHGMTAGGGWAFIPALAVPAAGFTILEWRKKHPRGAG